MAVRKRFGQHFLHDPAVIRRIVEAVAPVRGERIVEIGPGRGALTWALLERAGELDAIEIDRDLAELLRSDPRAPGRLRVRVADALGADLIELRGDGAPLRVVGNLPYNISTPVLFHLIGQRAAIADMHFMLQREVVERMAAEPGGKEYGRLTVMLAAYLEVERLFDVGPGAFQPPPRVWSSVVRLRPAAGPRFAIGSDRALQAVVSAAFSHRRKTLRNALRPLLGERQIEACGIDPDLRPATLAPFEFGKLAVSHSQNLAAGPAQSG